MAEIKFPGPPEDIRPTVKGASGDIGDLLDLIGQRVKESSVKAFRVSALGDISWPQQYPGVPAEDFANIAAALSDLNSGQKPKARRFQRKKPLKDTGELLKSIQHEPVGKNAVRIGTTKEYAPAHQFGLNTSQPVKPAAKKKLKEWMKRTALGKEHGHKLAHLLHDDVLWTQVAERPFLGLTDETEKKITADVQAFFKRRLEAKRA